MSEWRLDRLEERAGALLARRESGVSIADVRAQYATDPVGFAERVCGASLWDQQRAIALAVRDDGQVAVASGHACGKDFLGAHLALWWAYALGGLVLVTSATQRQVAEQFFGEVSRAFRRADLPGDCFQTMLRVPSPDGACGILGFTSESASSYSGFHGARVLVILSEAQGIEPEAWVGLDSCRTGADDRTLAVGNPLTNAGRFFECFRTPSWRTFQISCFEHPNLTGGKFIPGGPTQAWIDRVREDWGEGSPTYQSRVLGRFPSEGDENLIRRAWVDAAVQRWREWRAGTGTLRTDQQPMIFSCDPARFGADHTALAIRHGAILRELVLWHGADTMQTVGKLLMETDRLGVGPATFRRFSPAKRLGLGKPPGIVIDVAGGLGAGPFDRLREHPDVREFGFHLTAFNGGEKPSDEERFANRRAESYWHLRDLLEQGRIALPPDDRLAEELLATQWRPNSTGKIALEPKDDIRARLGRSPDRADAVTMAFANDLSRCPVGAMTMRGGW